MGCDACNHETNMVGVTMYFLRWKDTTLALVGCRDHVVEVMEAIQEVKKRRSDATEKTDGKTKSNT
jgi:hypothetical protein